MYVQMYVRKTYVRTNVRTYRRTVVQRRLYISALRCRDKNERS